MTEHDAPVALAAVAAHGAKIGGNAGYFYAEDADRRSTVVPVSTVV